MVNWVGLTVPFAYLGILVGSLGTFSSLYRKRKAAKSSSLEPWFGPHVQRDIYLSLLHLEPEPGKDKSPAVPDGVLKAALLHRAVEDIRRILEIRNAKQALGNLLQRGSVGDDLWQRFLRAEKEIEAELRDVVEEVILPASIAISAVLTLVRKANALQSAWGHTIFQSANEMHHNRILRGKLNAIQVQMLSDRDWWQQEKASIQSEFMKELEDGEKEAVNPVPSSGGEKLGSDEDSVLVESGGPAAPGTVSAMKGGMPKKRKGKK
ncbi:MAG: hypothetical protein LQ337_001446 [Flavoplaca oasis]|nr:MAG: hypothetical protein LQ337_001446 [Flavoplaca oasis]